MDMPLDTHSREPTLHHACSPSSRLPSQASAPLSSDANDDDACCPICLARFECARAAADLGSGSALTTACGHRFCAACLRMASHRAPRSLACAICRGRIHDCTERDDACALCRAGIATLNDMDRDIDGARRRAARFERRKIRVGVCIALPYASMFACLREDFCPIIHARDPDVPFMQYATIAVVVLYVLIGANIYVAFRLWVLHSSRAIALANSTVRNIRGHERVVPAATNHELTPQHAPRLPHAGLPHAV